MQCFERAKALGFPRKNAINLGRRYKIGPMREPPNPRVMVIAAEWGENRSRSNYIPGRAKLNDENIFGDRLVILAIIAMHTEFFVWSARNIAAKMAAILIIDERE